MGVMRVRGDGQGIGHLLVHWMYRRAAHRIRRKTAFLSQATVNVHGI
jgi:hypothetical protein